MMSLKEELDGTLDSSMSQVEEELGDAAGKSAVAQLSKPLAQLLANRQWWKVCWVYGDQQKYYRQLYGRKKNLSTLRSATGSGTGTGPSGGGGPGAGTGVLAPTFGTGDVAFYPYE